MLLSIFISYSLSEIILLSDCELKDTLGYKWSLTLSIEIKLNLILRSALVLELISSHRASIQATCNSYG